MKNHTRLLALTMIVLALTGIRSRAQSIYEPYTFTTLAGLAGSAGSDDGTGTAALFNYPKRVAVDSAGNVYVADSRNLTIRKVTPVGTNWVVTTLAGLAGSAGRADGTGGDARFAGPFGVAVDSASNVYVADTHNYTIRKVTQAGEVTTLAGLAGSAGLDDGTGGDARFSYPSDVAVDEAGNAYVADGDTIRKVTQAGVVTTLAGLGGFGPARFSSEFAVAVDGSGNVYVTGEFNTIRKVTTAGVVTTLAGSGEPGSVDGTASAAQFYQPQGVAVDSAGNVYVADTFNNTIRKGYPTPRIPYEEPYTFTTVAGGTSQGSVDGTGIDARFNQPSGVAVDSAGNVYVADINNNTIRKVTPTGVVTTLAGLGGSAVAVDTGGNLYLAFGSSIGKATLVGTNWVVTLVTTLAGLEDNPTGVAVDSAGNVYLADTYNMTIRKVTTSGVATTLAGLEGESGSADGTGSAARFNGPRGVAVDSAGNVYVADSDNYTIRKVTPTGVVTTLGGLAGSHGSADGTGSEARFGGYVYCGCNCDRLGPTGVAVDSAGNVYVADTVNLTIRKVTPAGVVTTLAGWTSINGSADGTGSDARFGGGTFNCEGCCIRLGPTGVAVDSAGNVYVADTVNNTIRKGYPASRLLISGPAFGFNGGSFGFNLTGPSGRLVVVEASTDLMSWLPLWTNTFAGALNFSDPQSGVSSHRFYRVHLP